MRLREGNFVLQSHRSKINVANFVSTLENLRLLVGFPLDLHRHPPARGHDDAGAGRSQNRRVDPARCAALAARRPGHLEVPPRKHLSSVSSRETGSRSRRSSPRWLVLGHGRGRVGGETRERRWSCRNSRRDLRGDSGTHPLPRGAPIRARARGSATVAGVVGGGLALCGASGAPADALRSFFGAPRVGPGGGAGPTRATTRTC